MYRIPCIMGVFGKTIYLNIRTKLNSCSSNWIVLVTPLNPYLIKRSNGLNNFKISNITNF